jgi:raffinose/stachyose/melibiose transport system substrate-binding protein
MMKRIFVLCMAAMMLLVAAGCKKEQSDASVLVSSNTDSPYYQQYPKDTAGIIEFYQQKAEAEDLFDSLIEEFQALYPNIKVEQNVQQDASAVLQTRVASGEFTDVWLYYPDAILATLARNGWLMDMTNLPFVKNSVEAIQKWYEYDGKLYGVPVTMNYGGIICNRGMFEKNGIALPDNWDSLLSACLTFKNKGINPLILTIKSGADNSNAMIWGNYITTEQVRQVARGEIKLSEIASWSEAIDRMLELFSFGQPNAISTDYNDGLTDFANEAGAMYISGNWTFNSIAAINPDLDFTMIPMPANKGYVTSGVDVGLSIGSKTKYPEACLAFVNWLASQEVAIRYAAADNAIIAVKEDETATSNNNLRNGKVLEALAVGKVFNWPSVYFPSGGASDAFYQRIGMLYIDRDKASFIKDVDDIMSGRK